MFFATIRIHENDNYFFDLENNNYFFVLEFVSMALRNRKSCTHVYICLGYTVLLEGSVESS